MNSRVRQRFLIIVMDSRGQELWSIQNIRTVYFYGFFTLPKTPNESASRIPEFKSSPASGSPSELSAHQMGLSLAGATRFKEEPTHSIIGTSTPPIDGHGQLSITDRALLRSMVSQVLGKKVLRDQLLTMRLFQRYRGLMGTLRERH